MRHEFHAQRIRDRNNAFDSHVHQVDQHQRLLTYVSDAVAGFLRDMERIGRAEDMVLSLGVVPASEAAMRSMAASNKLPSVSSLLVSVEICVANG